MKRFIGVVALLALIGSIPMSALAAELRTQVSSRMSFLTLTRTPPTRTWT